MLDLVALHLGLSEYLVGQNILSKLTQLLISGPQGGVDIQSSMEVLFGIGVPLLLFCYDSQQIQSKTAIRDDIEVLIGLGCLLTQKSLLSIFELVDLEATQGKLVPVAIRPALLEDVDHFIVLVFGHIAICQ
jgi:hypothetical protein